MAWHLSWKIAGPGAQSSCANGLGDRTVLPARYCSNHRVEITMPTTASHRAFPIVVCAITGLLGGLALMAGTHADIVAGPVAGSVFGALFAIVFANRAVDRGSGLLWGLGYALLLLLA